MKVNGIGVGDYVMVAQKDKTVVMRKVKDVRNVGAQIGIELEEPVDGVSMFAAHLMGPAQMIQPLTWTEREKKKD